MRRRAWHFLAVLGLANCTLSLVTRPAALSQETSASPKWEYQAVRFDRDEKVSTTKLNELSGEGWEYVGPLAHGLVAFRRPARVVGLAPTPSPKAVYAVFGKGRLSSKELERHPEVRVVHSFQELERVASKRTAIWIDVGALGMFGDREREWVIRLSRKKYPFVLVGYNNALYSFREQLDCFLISGPGPIDWTQYQLTPGFSVIMLEEKPAEGGRTDVSGFMRGYKQAPTVEAVLGVTDALLAGKPVPEMPGSESG